MPRIKHRTEEEIRKENLLNKLEMENEHLKANLDYVAMMTDVDIPTTEEAHA